MTSTEESKEKKDGDGDSQSSRGSKSRSCSRASNDELNRKEKRVSRSPSPENERKRPRSSSHSKSRSRSPSKEGSSSGTGSGKGEKDYELYYKKKSCYKCGGQEHLAKMCPSANGAINDPNAKQCNVCKGKGHEDAMCPNNNEVNCTQCGKSGHRGVNCPNAYSSYTSYYHQPYSYGRGRGRYSNYNSTLPTSRPAPYYRGSESYTSNSSSSSDSSSGAGDGNSSGSDGSTSSSEPYEKLCYICRGKHLAKECDKCKNCLESGHHMKDCPKPRMYRGSSSSRSRGGWRGKYEGNVGYGSGRGDWTARGGMGYSRVPQGPPPFAPPLRAYDRSIPQLYESYVQIPFPYERDMRDYESHHHGYDYEAYPPQHHHPHLPPHHSRSPLPFIPPLAYPLGPPPHPRKSSSHSHHHHHHKSHSHSVSPSPHGADGHHYHRT